MSLSRIGFLMRRPALLSVLLLVLVGQGLAATHAHFDAEPLPEVSECLICPVSASIGDVDIDATRRAVDGCRTYALVPFQPDCSGFHLRRTANARAPPTG